MINKLVPLFCSHWKKACPTFCCTNSTCKSKKHVCYICFRKQPKRQSSTMLLSAYSHVLLLKALFFRTDLICLFQKKGHSAFLWREKKKERHVCQYLILLKKISSRSVFQWWSKNINEVNPLFLASASEDMGSLCILSYLSATGYDPKILFRVTTFQNTSCHMTFYICLQINGLTLGFLCICSLIVWKWPVLAMIQLSINHYLQTFSKFILFSLSLLKTWDATDHRFILS